MTTTSKQSAATQRKELLDCTLRDGSYAVDFQFDETFVVGLLERLSTTPLRRIEIGHGLGLEAERSGVTPGNIDHHRWSEIAASVLTSQLWGMFAQPNFTRLSTVAKLSDRGMSFLRVGMEPDRVSANLDYLREAVDVCDEVYLNLMKSSDTPSESLLRLLDGVPEAIAGVYIVDSCGTMLPSDVQRYVSAATEIVDVVGFHGHDNLGMANINSITALESGAAIADGTLNGIGRGAGNAQLESLAGILTISDADRFDYKTLAHLADYCRLSLAVIPEDRSMQLLGGVIGMHSGHFPLIRELCAEHAIEPAPLMEAAVGLTEHSPSRNDLQAAARQVAGDHRPIDSRRTTLQVEGVS